MKTTKQYIFTENEMMVLRNALIEYFQFMKKLNPNSPIAAQNKKICESLKNQFIHDYMKNN